MTNAKDAQRDQSAEACPVCGQHTLHLLYFPTVDVTGARQYDDMLGFGDIKPEEPPGIGCTSCGSEWPTLEDFRAAPKGESPMARTAADVNADTDSGADTGVEPDA